MTWRLRILLNQAVVSRSLRTQRSYNVFLKSHGGSSNAYTDSTSTNYHFDVTYQVSVPNTPTWSPACHGPTVTVLTPACTAPGRSP